MRIAPPVLPIKWYQIISVFAILLQDIIIIQEYARPLVEVYSKIIIPLLVRAPAHGLMHLALMEAARLAVHQIITRIIQTALVLVSAI